ncbi:MAG: hypothetical protein WCS70_09700 [Verrucomicrobiota bacterium]
MIEDGFKMLLTKFAHDARAEMRAQRQRAEDIRLRRILSEKVYYALKRIFLVLALIGVGFGFYYGHALGALMGEMSYGPMELDDPSLRGIPVQNAKRLRKMKEQNREHNKDIDEVNEFTDNTR